MYLSKPKGLTFRLISVFLIFFCMISFIFPEESLAYRSRDGGGEIVNFDFGKWAASAAIGMVSSAVGGAIASGIGGAFSTGSTFSGNFVSSLSSLSNFDSWGTNFVNNTAVGQVQNAVGMAGKYYGWDPGPTVFISSIAGGIVGGGLSPGHFGSSLGSGLGVSQSLNGSLNALKGMGMGLLEGTVEGAILMGSMRSDNGKGTIDPIMGNIANLAGSLTTGALVGGLTGPTGEFSFANIGDINFTGAGQQVLSVALNSIPSSALSMGVQSLTSGNMDRQDAAIIKSAFTGLYYVVNAPTNYAVDKKIMPSLFGNQQSNQIANQQPNLISNNLQPNSNSGVLSRN